MFKWSVTMIASKTGPLSRALIAASVAIMPVFPANTGETRANFGFDLNVVLSEKAQRKLATDKESLAVLVNYFGSPTKSAQKHADEAGQINLSGSYSMLLPVGVTRVHISGKRVERQRLAWIDGPVMVNVNVISGRRSNPDNLLACDIIDGPVSQLQSAPTTLHCGLITENPDTTVRP